MKSNDPSLRDLERQFASLQQSNRERAKEIVELARGFLLVVVGISDDATRNLTVSIIKTLGYDRVRAYPTPEDTSRGLAKHFEDVFSVIVDEKTYQQVSGLLAGYKGRILMITEDQECVDVEPKASVTEPVTRVLQRDLNRSLVDLFEEKTA